MPFFFTFILFFLGLFPALVLSNFNSTQTKGQDTVRKNDINSIYQKLEEHYNEYGEYPTIKELTIEYDEQLPGIEKEALYDENGVKINELGSEYTYSPEGCTALGCAKYTLAAILGDGTEFTKDSLN